MKKWISILSIVYKYSYNISTHARLNLTVFIIVLNLQNEKPKHKYLYNWKVVLIVTSALSAKTNTFFSPFIQKKLRNLKHSPRLKKTLVKNRFWR